MSNRNIEAFLHVRSEQEYGAILVESIPEQGMLIFLNGRNTGKITPSILENVPSGTQKIRLDHPLYRSQEKEVEVLSGQTLSVNFEMIASYAELRVNTNQDAIIYLNGLPSGTTSWTGRVGTGDHTIRVEKDGFITREYKVHVLRNRDMNVDLMMTLKTGTLDITTDPPQAMISLNGRMYGLSPRIISDLPFGEYSLTAEKADHTTVFMRVVINDTKPVKLEILLASGKFVTLKSNPPGADVIFNQVNEGTTPLILWLKYGNNTIKFEKDGISVVENILVSQGGRKEYLVNLRKTNDPFEDQMVFVRGGTFSMGDTFGDGIREEKPVHQVTVSDFYISMFEVTQAQWLEIMGNNPSHFSGCDQCPVERVSWLDTQEFIAKLNELTGEKYRLPTEAEWEYAAKGGQESKGFRYAGLNNINFVSWYSGNSENKTHPVGQKEPNELGIFDMSGNVWEWTWDWFDYYTDTPQTNPVGPDEGDFRIVRGGSWFGYVGGSRVACRGSDDPSNRRSYIGFRLVKTVHNE